MHIAGAIYLAVASSMLAICWTYPTTQKAQPQNATKLRPIVVNDHEAALGLPRRKSENFADLDLQTQSRLIYGSPGGRCLPNTLPIRLIFTDDGQLLLAKMTLYAEDGLEMIMMENFEGLTSAVDCKGDDDTISLTFKSPQAFDYALKTWSHINEKDEYNFLLIANHDGCGPVDERQPYLISKIMEDSSQLTSFLTARAAPWSEVAGTFDLDFGKAYPYSRAQSLHRRGFLDDVKGGISDTGDDLESGLKDARNANLYNFDGSRSVTFNVGVGQEGQRSNIYTDSKGRLTVDCINCFVKGSVEVTGHLSMKGWSLRDFSINASPHGLAAELELETVITATGQSDSLQYSTELSSGAIPHAGIEISGIFKLGATLSYDIGGGASFHGSATVDFGLKSSIPDSAKAVLDLKNPGDSSATGFNGDVTPIFEITKLSAYANLTAFSQLKLVFGIEIIEIFKADMTLSLKLPEVSVALTAEYDEAGVCSQDAGSSKTGVEVKSDISVSLSAGADLDLGMHEGEGKPSWSKELYSWKSSLESVCFPLAIPGLGSTSNTTQVPSLSSSSISISTISSGVPSSLTLSVPSAIPIVSKSNSLYASSSTVTTGRYHGTGVNASTPSTQRHQYQSHSTSNYTSYVTESLLTQTSSPNSGASHAATTDQSGKDAYSSTSNTGRSTISNPTPPSSQTPASNMNHQRSSSGNAPKISIISITSSTSTPQISSQSIHLPNQFSEAAKAHVLSRGLQL